MQGIILFIFHSGYPLPCQSCPDRVFAFLIPFDPGERVKQNPGESVSCLSEVKRSEFDSGHPCPSPFGRTFGASISSILKKFIRGPDFPSERTDPKGGFTGCLFFGPFF